MADQPPSAPPPLAPHCPLSRCETDPSYCGTHIRDDEYAAIVSIIATPILLAFFAPIVAARWSKVRTWCGAAGDDDRQALSPTHRAMIDPPMFLCGVGLLPLECGLSGLLTVIWVMCLAVVVVFFMMLNSAHPCSTGLGECRTISCMCGNVLPEGYVFMFCSLMITSLILVQRIARMYHHMRRQHKILKAVLIAGALLLTLTGIFPERYDQNNEPLIPLYALHLFGVYGACLLLLCVPFGWFANHWVKHRHELPLSSLLVRSTYFVAVVCFGTALYVYGSDVIDQVSDYCSAITSEAECSAWPTMTPGECADALACVSNTSVGVPKGAPAACDGFVQPNFGCTWSPTELNNWTRIVAPDSYKQARACVRTSCPLYAYARGVALEFAVLLLTLCYVATFGLHDVRRLLDRPPSTAAGDAAPIIVALDASRLMADAGSATPANGDSAAAAAAAAGNPREKRLAEMLQAAGDDAAPGVPVGGANTLRRSM